ncbi:hypothetical protein Tsubulata_008593 [Turnera subulata]|uniref:Uncharacterized protein n=1 Tax=Turnera subulata TaxID=218843 RepID=A0A9Q0F6N2_9ROSI|nr:hypothetical protein Tsubulata_008593 [Turnera subulata]
MQRKRLAEVVAMVVEAHRKGYSGGTDNRKKGAKKKKKLKKIGFCQARQWGSKVYVFCAYVRARVPTLTFFPFFR